jgi:RimJ/RimL family protein N-acetyltransferase
MTPSAPPAVRLRDIVAADLPTLFRHQLDPDANRMCVANPRDAEAFSAHWAKILADPTGINKAVLLGEELVGRVTCFRTDDQTSVGYWIGKEHWGRGIATRALALLLELVPARPLHARAARTNVASIRVLERCGFVLTGYRMSPPHDLFPECEEALLVLE